MSFLRKRRGVSGIISGLFLVAVAVMAFNVLAWQFFQYDAYRQIALERDQREWERFNERVVITDIGYGSYLRFKVRNNGAVTAHIVTIYLNDTTTNNPRTLTLKDYICANCSAWISPGIERWIYTTIPMTLSNTYDLKIATERGNLGVLVEFKASGQTPEGTQTVPFTFSFMSEDFQYAPTLSGPWSNAWVFTITSSDVYFRLKVKNTAGGNVQIETISHLNFVTVLNNNLVSKANNGLTSAVSLANGEQGWLYFDRIAKTNFSGETYYYVFVAIFWHYTDPPSATLGANMAILAVKIAA